MSQSRVFRLYLVRHGATAWNVELRIQGHTDVPLNAEGCAQARCIAARLASSPLPPQAVWSSDLLRARQTAEAIAAPLGLSVQTTPLLRETMLGEWEGLTSAEIEARGEQERLERWRREPHHYRPPGGETLEAAWDRMLEAAALIRAAHPSGAVAVVGHGGTLKVLLCATLGIPVNAPWRFWLDNASLSIIEELGPPENPRCRVTLVNDTSHLAALAMAPE
ncbi:MAG TPA: histidine phosphatase family protein [Chthonomonadaceae bacterium]|nr:histidine phosphatase family protein [Chthonomonadaceae bacterium]